MNLPQQSCWRPVICNGLDHGSAVLGEALSARGRVGRIFSADEECKARQTNMVEASFGIGVLRLLDADPLET